MTDDIGTDASTDASTPTVTTGQDLPIPDYDHLPVGSLGHRIRSLEADELAVLVAYEQEHGARVPVLAVLDARLQELADGAEPSAGDAAGLAPEQAPPPSGGSPASPATVGPPQNPPSHGDPTNPSQPRG
ncbi:hypothetical protein [Cellulomonas marina]|uniref:DUF8129 domain-containing protein n=1 Tax=Cellulomonas marina TaxID=988821 RepID=A0A1I1AMJ3_9CELL|nr:hypothetical protein [Cellulomonas marina]GIG30441.1 hypothetical protein Cma02nite_30410 [Cellulomonas marina]SFB39157.1 hypothetical protein SAMN05421867_12025 [Cellulomonas marina]